MTEALAYHELDIAVAGDLGPISIQRQANAKRRLNRASGMILVSDRRPEQRHDSIAEELVDRAFVPVNLGENQLEGSSHQTMDDLRIQPLAQCGEARDVHEQHRHLFPLALKRAL
jgi:hypothetical protein